MKIIPKIKAPKGYSFKIDTIGYRVRVILSHNKKQIGRVSLHKSYYLAKTYETHSSLEEEYRGQGLGVLMYARAIQWALEHGYRIKSSGSTAGYAQRVWESKSLRKYFVIKKTFKMERTCPTWRAYAKIKK